MYSTSVTAQTGPVFTPHPDITVSCGESIPDFADCEATSPDCPGPVTITSFTGGVGGTEHYCTITPSKLNNSIGWAFWLSLENMPVERWKFDGTAYLAQYADGTAHLWGTIVNYQNSSYKFEVSLWFAQRKNWSEWSALGRGYRNDSGLVGNNYLNWDYYELMGEFSTFTGIEGLAGNYLNIAPYPTSLYYGFQSGIGANNKNANPGFGGSFSYSGMVLGEHCGAGVGKLSVDTSCGNDEVTCAANTQTRICKATDNCGNTAFQTQQIHIVDTTPPTVIDFESEISVECGDHYATFLTATDDCSDVIITYVDVIVVAGCGGQLQRTYTVSDACGNFVTRTQMIHLLGDAAPEFVVFPADTLIECNQLEELNNAVIQWTGPCNNITLSSYDVTVDGNCPGNYTLIRTYTLMDDCGNVTSRDWTIQIQDTMAPVISGVPENVAMNCGDTIVEVEVTAQDGCDMSIVNVNLVATTEPNACGYNFIRTWTATDACGNTAQAVQTISLTDTEPPVFSFVPENINLACSTGTTPDDLPLATATDDCLGVIVLYEDTPIDGNCGQGILRTFTATDACGNSVTATQQITFTDDEAPVFTFVPQDLSLACGEDVNLPDAIAIDNCSDVTISFEDDFSSTCGGGFTRHYTATDGCNNTTTASVTVTILDTQAPTVSAAPADITVDCNNIPSVDEAQLEYTDNCGAVHVDYTETISQLPGTCANNYSIIRQWTLTDDCDNSTVVTWNILVEDTTAPVLQGIPANTTLNCGDEIPEAAVSAQDNCDGNINVNLVASTSFHDCGYNFIRTWTATDACGNTSEAIQTITLNDNEPPVFSFIPEDVNLACADGTSLEDLELATATDDCLGVSVIYNDTPILNGIERTFIATDACGNTISATQQIIFSDTEAPIFTFVPDDIISECGQNIQLADPTAEDNCSEVTITYSDELLGVCNSFIRTYVATDASGNSTTAVVTVSLNDTTAPVITGIPANATISCGETPMVITPLVSDNCTPSNEITISVEESTQPTDCGYMLTRTWTATDGCGNTASAYHVTTLVDNTAPQFTFVPADMDVVCGSDYTLEDPIAVDDCSNFTLTIDTILGTNCAGSFTRVFTVVDACGNTATASQSITITDNIDPQFITVPENVTVSCTNIPAVDMTAITYSDNCSAVTVSIAEDIEEGDCPGNYILTRLIEIQDACGNRNNHNWVITVVDTDAPVFVNQAPNLVLDCSAPIPPLEVLATDVCSSTIEYANDVQNIPTDCGYQLIRTRTATDACGNSATLTQTVTVEDFAPPVFSFLPENLTLSCNQTIPSIQLPTATDLCSGDVFVTVTETVLPGTCSSNFTMYRVYRSSDDCGNEAMHIQTITVADTTGPEFLNFEPEIIINCEQSNTPYVIVLDNCSSASLSFTDEVFGSPCNGGIVRTYIATDGCNNQTVMQQMITLEDEVAPVFLNFPSNLNVSCDAVPPASSAQVEYMDNCSDVEVNYSESSIPGDCPGNYTLERTWSITDACFNTTTATWTIEVTDTEAPIITGVPEDVFIDCTDAIPPADVIAIDNCSDEVPVTLIATTVPEGCGEIFIRRWYAEDACGNLTQAIQNVIISDMYAPVLSEYPADMTLPCGAPVPPVPTITATDNCANDVVVEFTELIDGTPNCPIITREWCATDCVGNEECHIQTITFSTNANMVVNQMNAWTISSRQAKVSVSSSNTDHWTLSLFDLSGKEVSVLFDGTLQSGESRTFTFNPEKFGDGMYLVRYTNGSEIFTQKLYFSE